MRAIKRKRRASYSLFLARREELAGQTEGEAAEAVKCKHKFGRAAKVSNIVLGEP